jgi:hypothetical protein
MYLGSVWQMSKGFGSENFVTKCFYRRPGNIASQNPRTSRLRRQIFSMTLASRPPLHTAEAGQKPPRGPQDKRNRNQRPKQKTGTPAGDQEKYRRQRTGKR